MLNTSSPGRVGQAQAVCRPERRTIPALKGDGGKHLVAELIDPDVLTLTLLDAHRETLAVRRQAGARKHPWFRWHLGDRTRPVQPDESSSRAGRRRHEHQRAGGGKAEIRLPIASTGLDVIEQLHRRAGHLEAVQIEGYGK